ncbi:DUF2913 domain-containing protein [Photobacterium sanctipauli]|uniref:DUF2913 domain-containing protein n=1 Tax=Photobacterium sanctipauli TaxID=1342794 RepID=A0A2T3NYK9_9GAMM|nr:DUF2913 family protein [Photobacterium sanctipauli]PSW21361.1 DUF2913 domain-containing protein [Photobacterium sanctipauli]
MASFYQEIYKVVTEGLSTLSESQAAGKTPRNPVSEAHFMNLWVTKVIKQQAYDHCVAKTLIAWQKQARSMGKNAQLKQLFEHIQSTLSATRNEEGCGKLVAKPQIDTLFEQLEDEDWLLTTEYEINRKVTHHTDGQASLIVCSAKAKEAFSEQGELIKPLSFFVRGDAKALVNMAFGQGLLLYKVTDYKSIVKYHGEYVVYPGNAGTHLPELPVQ